MGRGQHVHHEFGDNKVRDARFDTILRQSTSIHDYCSDTESLFGNNLLSDLLFLLVGLLQCRDTSYDYTTRLPMSALLNLHCINLWSYDLSCIFDAMYY